MKSKWQLFAAIFQLIVGIMAIICFVIVVGFAGENFAKWLVTLLLAVAFVVLGIMGIIDYKTKK